MKYRFLSVVLLLNCLPIALLVGADGDSSEQKKAAAVAAEFINSYVKAIPQFESSMSGADWVKRSPLASPEFKKRLADLYRQALRDDPEMGYGADAVLGAQDYPDSFKVQSVRIDGDQAAVELLSTEPFEMELRMTLIRHEDSWLVDGSGDLVE
ncbi:MAG: hypothetical protein ACOVMP_11780 [Chthoniobacterales bacterium]